MAKSSKEIHAAFRSRNAALGRKRKEWYVTDEEAVKMKAYLKEIRVKLS